MRMSFSMTRNQFTLSCILTFTFLLFFNFLLLEAQQVALLLVERIMSGQEACAVVLIMLQLWTHTHTHYQLFAGSYLCRSSPRALPTSRSKWNLLWWSLVNLCRRSMSCSSSRDSVKSESSESVSESVVSSLSKVPCNSQTSDPSFP